LEKVPLREIWKNEAKDFTRWLEENIESLNEALDLSLSSVEHEQPVGDFNVDLTAEDSNGDRAIIECQLEKTDHDHMGKIITYLTNLDAKTAIWICKEPRDEHRIALTWLNESSPPDISFYLVKVEGVKIGDSPPAPLFTVVCRPSVSGKEFGHKKQEFAERHMLRQQFWTQLLEKCKQKTKLFSNISPGKYNWIGTGAGTSGLAYNFVIAFDWVTVELYIDKGKDSEELNKRIFDQLFSEKSKIEAEFGGNLEWQRLDDRRASRIRIKYDDAGIANADKWSDLQDKMIDAMIRLEHSLKGYIAKLPSKLLLKEL
jgi:hypothetical protein